MTDLRGNRLHAVGLAAVVILAAFFRLFRLDSIPPGLFPDEAMNGNDALASLRTGVFPVFYEGNNGREGLLVWIMALAFRLLGPSIWSLRLPSALIGVLTVVAVYSLGRELHGRRVALWAAFLLCSLFWHVNLSRMGLRAILVPLVMSLGFAVLWRALRTGSTGAFLLAGVLFGAGVYTYIAFRAALLLLGIFLLFAAYGMRPTARGTGGWEASEGATRWKLGGLIAAAALVALPLTLYFAGNPEALVKRARRVSVFVAEDPARVAAQNTLKTLGMFFVRGDRNVRHNHPGAPMLPVTVSPLFALGLARALREATAGGRRSGPPSGSSPPLSPRGTALFLLGWLGIMMLPAVLAARGAPHALRSLGMLPAVLLLAARGADTALVLIGRLGKSLTLAFGLCLVAATTLTSYRSYFVTWAEDPAVKAAFRQDLVSMASYLQSLPGGTRSYVVANDKGLPEPDPEGLPMPVQTLVFLLHEPCSHGGAGCPTFVSPSALDSLAVDRDRPSSFAFMRDEGGERDQVAALLPGGVWRRSAGFLVYSWPR